MAFPIVPRYRSGSAGNPTSLNLGELAVNTHDGSLYLGADVGVVQIGVPVAAGTELTEWTANGSASQFAPINGYNGTDPQGYLVTVQGIDQPFTVTSANGGTLVFDFTPTAGSVIRARAITQASGGGGGGGGDATSIQGVAVDATAPTDGQLLKANADGSAWVPGSPLVLGAGASSTAANGIAIGVNAQISDEYTQSGNVSIGESANAVSSGISIGNSASTSQSAVAFGNSSVANSQAIAIGFSTQANNNGIAIGMSAFGSNGASANGIAIGAYATAIGGGIAIGCNQSVNTPDEVNVGGYRLDLIQPKINEIITWVNSNGGSITPL